MVLTFREHCSEHSFRPPFKAPEIFDTWCSRMERLISHLQETLAEDEAVKEALLHLRNTNDVDTGPASNTSHGGGLSMPLKCTGEHGNVFLLELIVSSVLQTCSAFLDLPVRIVASRLGITAGLLHNICATQTYCTEWSPNLLHSMEQVTEVYSLALQRGVCAASLTQRNKLLQWRDELNRLSTAPQGSGQCVPHLAWSEAVISVTRFITFTVAKMVLDAVLSTALECSTALPLELPHCHPSGPPLGTREVCLEGAHPPSKVVLLAPLEMRPRCPKHL